ncbi:conserved hypothetical protein [Theileria orientalis strain Shintoku]|uniref:Uncharacterized protein n=1 Tax=Theileria orientalis strain Shintoku TaxID=869250 RepID=J4CDM8_THEOR|nr:conserved hypothetical protein [Theileria orientalis strain Shintoku]BAM41417.1 conserved hypothetical protein [Theileria orientalis strain Shintoku]|eukprot:XP_009691718.1 conserved hypothetical protein [Theileria orientalis strain Shintoku]
MKVQKSSNTRTRLKKPELEPHSSSNLPKFGKIEGFELDEVIFSLLDGLVDTNERSRDTIVKTLMKYATHQPDFILKSILTFLQVQKTSINHQHSLLCFVKRCLVELKNVPNGVIKEILIFMLKELSFLKSSDVRYVEMREIVNTATVLCPAFSVDVILAFIKDIKQSEENFEVLCIYIRILTHLCKLVPRNSYVKSILISSHIMCLYNKEIFKEQNAEICKELSSLLFNLANMLTLNSAHSRSSHDPGSDGIQRATLVKLINGDELGRRHTQLYDALDLEVGIQNKFRSVHRAHFEATTSEHLSHSNAASRLIRKISRPSLENIKSILEPLYELMLDYYIPKIYINSSYNNICLELLYSLVVISEYVSTECLRENSLNLLNCIIVRFLYHVPNLQFNDNLWFKLYKINSTNLTNRFVSLFSNLNLLNGLPPKFFIVGMRSYLQILSQYNEHNIYINSYNLCNILFSLLKTLYDNANKHLLLYLQWFLSDNGSLNNDAQNDLEFDSVYIDNIIQSLRILYNNSSSLALIEFLYDKLMSVTKSDVIVAMYVFIFLFNASDAVYSSRMSSMVRTESMGSNSIGSNRSINSSIGNNGSKNNNNASTSNNIINSSRSYSSNTLKRSGSISNACITSDGHSRAGVDSCNQLIMYRIVNNISGILNLNINDNYSLYIMIKFVNMLFLSRSVTLYSTFNSMFDKEDMERRNKKIYFMINYIFEYKINIDISNRINMNMKWYNSKSGNKLDVLFFYSLYQCNTVGKNELPANKFIKNELVSNEEELFEQCVENIIRSCTDYFLVYLVNKLMKNVKRNSLTIFEYLSKVLKLYSKQKVKRVLKQDELYNLLILALIYIHDPVNYFGEAYYASKLLFRLYDTMNNISNSMSNDAFKQSFLYPNDIVLNFSNVSKLTRYMNSIHKVDGASVIRCLSSLMEQLKNRPNLSRNSSFSITTSTFLNPGSTLFGSNQVSVMRVNDVVIDTDLSTFHNLGIVNVICTFTSVKEGIVGAILSNAATSAVTNKEDMMQVANDGELEAGEEQLLFWSRSLEMKYKIFMLNGMSMSNAITGENWKGHLKMLDDALISNTLKDSSFSLFGKTASYLQSERNRLIVISALTHAYIQADTTNNSVGDTTKEEKKQAMEELSDRYNRIVAVFNAKRDKLLAEKEGKAEKKSEERECGYEEDHEHVVNRYILCPMINMFNNDTDVNVQECILNNVLLIVNQASLSNFRIDIEVISLMFNKMIGIMMRVIDENVKATEEKIEQMCEKNEILNVERVNRSVSEKEGALAYCSFLVMSSFSPHFRMLRSTNVPYLVMYYTLYYADYYFYAKVANFDVNFSFSYEFHRSLKIFRHIHYYLTNMYNNIAKGLNGICWDVLYKMTITILSDNNKNLDAMVIKNRLFILVQFLDAFLPNGKDLRKDGDQRVERQLESEDEDDWVKLVILVWCYILKMGDNNTKVLLIDILYRLLSVQSDVIIEDVYLNGIDSINRLIPERLVVKFVVFSMNYLEVASYVSNSLVKIIHRMMQQNMSMISTEHLQASLVVIFKRFHESFHNNNLPLFLRSFLVDMFKYNTNILFTVLFKYSLKFQSSVIFIIIKNDYLLHLLIEHLDSRINDELSKYFQLSEKVSCGGTAGLEYYGSGGETKEFEVKELEPVGGECKEHGGKVSEVCVERGELALEYLLEYNMIIFSNKSRLISCYSEYVTRLIVYVNVIEAVSSDLNVLIKQKRTLEGERAKMVKLLEVIYGNAMVSRDSLLHYSVKIIGSNRSTLRSFLNYTYRVISLFGEPIRTTEDSDDIWKDKGFREAREELLRRVLLRILVDLIKYRLLKGYDLTVLKIIRRLDSDYELIYYYLKNMHRLARHYGAVENVICLVLKYRTFFADKRLRHAYLVLYAAVLRYLRGKHRSLNRFENLRSYLMFPTAVAMLSSGTRKLEAVSSKCLRLFFSLSFGDWLDVSALSLSEEILAGLMVRGNTANRCPCNCNAGDAGVGTAVATKASRTAGMGNRTSAGNAVGATGIATARGTSSNHGVVGINGDDADLFTESGRAAADSHILCVCNCFQLLHIFSHFMPSASAQNKQSGEGSASNIEGADEGIVVPASINEEFRSIKRSQLDRKSSKVLFSSITVEEEDFEFIDINAYYGLKLHSIMPLIRTSSSEDRAEHVCPDVLTLFDVCDYAFKVGTAKSNFMYNSDSLEEYFQNTVNRNNLSLLQLKSLSSIGNSFLFLSKNVYRFITTQKYLQHNLMDIYFPQCSFSSSDPANDRNPLFSLKSASRLSASMSPYPTSPSFEDSVVFNAVKLSVFLITRASLYLYKSNLCSDYDSPLEDLEPFGLHKSLSVIRRNHLIHFESLCNVVVSKLCRLIDDVKFKLYVYRQLQLLATISPL